MSPAVALPFADLRVQLAFGASGPPDNWVWTDVTPDLYQQQLQISQGRANEAVRVQPASLSFRLENEDGRYTPGNPLSPHWPNVLRHTPVRAGFQFDQAAITFFATGGQVSTPDHASLDITGDIEVWVRCRLAIDATTPLASKYQAANDQRSWRFRYQPGGDLSLRWSADGTSSLAVISSGSFDTGLFAKALWLGFTLDVDDGAGGHAVRFFYDTTPDRSDPQQLGDPQSAGAFTTGLFASTTQVLLGADDELEMEGPNTFPPSNPALLLAAEILDGIGGTIVADPTVTRDDVGNTTFQDSTGKTWTLDADNDIVPLWELRFAGRVSAINQDQPWGTPTGEASVAVAAAGELRRLTQGAKPLRSALTRQVMFGSFIGGPIGSPYWPMEDGSDATSLMEVSGAQEGPITAFSGLSLAADNTLPGSAPLPNVPSGQAASWSAPLNENLDLHAYVLLLLPTGPGSSVQVLHMRGAWHADYGSGVEPWGEFRLLVSSTTITIERVQAETGAVSSNTFSADPAMFGQWSEVRLSVRFASNDNVEWGWRTIGGDSFNGTADALGSASVEAISSIGASFTAPTSGISFGHVRVRGGQHIGVPTTVMAGWVGETAGDRVVRLASENGVALLLVGETADSEPMGPQPIVSLPELLQECADTDLGLLGERVTHDETISAPRGLIYRTRHSLYNQPPAVTLDAQAAQITKDIGLVLDDFALRNDVTASRPEGTSARVVDDESVDDEGTYDETVTVNVAGDDQLPQQAAWRVHLGTWPESRISKLTAEFIDPASADLSAWKQLRLGDLIRLINLPAPFPADTIDLLVQGYSETITDHYWRIAATCTPAGPWTVGVLDASGTPNTSLARLDTDGSELATAIDADDTSLSVTVSAGPLWTTASAQLPLDILVDGERMTVTAISGATSPQTFTVTRAVNGIAKSHAAATPVAAADPFRLAL